MPDQSQETMGVPKDLVRRLARYIRAYALSALHTNPTDGISYSVCLFCNKSTKYYDMMPMSQRHEKFCLGRDILDRGFAGYIKNYD